MIINFSKDKNALRCNSDFASAVSEFADVLQDETLGVNLLAYVAYVTDEAEDNVWASLPVEIRKKEVADSLKIEPVLLKSPKVIAALKKYKVFVESNVGYQFKAAYNNGMKKISDYVNAKKSLGDEDAKEFSAVMKEMPIILKGKGEIEKVGTKEADKSRVRGNRTLTVNEQSQK